MNPPLNESVLQQHASGLRAVARGLLSDEHAAEDVVQETWIAAMERPPASDSRLSGWLAGVTRRLALRRLRTEGRRKRREEGASRKEALAPVDENLAQREVLRTVIDAVLALEEPYQSVVFLRYYQDLPPREIAKRLDMPVATVKSRLHRALESLRRRLDAEAGGERRQWALALAAVTGWPPATTTVPTEPTPTGTTGEWTMGWKLMAGGLAALVTGVSATQWTGVGVGGGATLDPRGEVAQLEGEPGAALGALEVPDDVVGEDGGRQVVAAGDGAAVVRPTGAVAGAHVFTLSGTVRDEVDLPLDGAHVFVGPLGQPLNDLGETDGDGRFEVQWSGHAASMEVAIAVRANRREEHGLRRIRLKAGQPNELAFVLPMPKREPTKKLKARLALAEQQLAEGREGARVELESLLQRTKKVAAKVDAHSIAPRTSPFVAADGRAWFRWPTAASLDVKELPAGSIARLELVEKVRMVELETSERRLVEAELHLERARREEAVPKDPVRVSGTVIDAFGDPVANSTLAIRGAGDESEWARMGTGADGSFFFMVSDTDVLELRAGGGDRGRASASFALADLAHDEVSWDAVLDRGLELAGRLVTDEGTPLAGWVVEWTSTDASQPLVDRTRTDATGSFSIPNLPNAGGHVVARAPDSDVFVYEVAKSVRPGTEYEWRLDVQAPSAMQLVVHDASGEPMPHAEVRVWQADTGRGDWAAWDEKREAFVLEGAVPGSYRVVAGTVANGFVDLGAVHLTAGETVELPNAVLPEPGKLEWQVTGADPMKSTWTLFRRGEQVDTLVAAGILAKPFEDEVAGGEYTLEVVTPSGRLPRAFLELAPGATASAALDEASLDEYELDLGLEEERQVTVRSGKHVIASGVVPAGGRLALLLEPGTFQVEVAGERPHEVVFPVDGGPIEL